MAGELEVIDLNDDQQTDQAAAVVVHPVDNACSNLRTSTGKIVSGLPKEFDARDGSNESSSVTSWLTNIINEYNNENIKLYEKELIRDKNQTAIKGLRDLEDGFVIGLAVRYHCPNLLSPHNLPRSFKKRQKQINWKFMNERVFDRIGFKIDDQLINDIIERDKQKLIEFVVQLKKMLEEHYPKIPVDPKSSKMMLRPLEEIYNIPSVINSRKSKRKVHSLRSFNLLSETDRQILLDKDSILSQHRVCINELEARFKALQGDIKQRKTQIHNLENGKVEEPEQKKAKCCCTIS